MEDEVFLSKHTSNSFIDIGKLMYVDFKLYIHIVYEELKRQQERVEAEIKQDSIKVQ